MRERETLRRTHKHTLGSIFYKVQHLRIYGSGLKAACAFVRTGYWAGAASPGSFDLMRAVPPCHTPLAMMGLLESIFGLSV